MAPRETLSKKFPKIELHRHLEGSFHLPTLHKMAIKNDLDFPKNFEDFQAAVQFPKDAKPDFLLFLSKFFNGWYADQADVYEVVYNSVLRLDMGESLRYVELRFNPVHYAINKNFNRVETMKTVMSAIDSATRDANLNLRGIITFNRHMQDGAQMIDLLKSFEDNIDMSRVVGIDLAGDEARFPPENFEKFFRHVHDKGYRATIHAGEVSGPEQIWTAIDRLYADRIGHGVAAIRDEELQRALKERGVALEMCLTSNYQTGAWIDTARHPMKDLLAKGLLITACSDDPTVQNCTLNDDYALAESLLGFGKEEFTRLNLNAIDAAFLNAEEKSALRASYQSELDAI